MYIEVFNMLIAFSDITVVMSIVNFSILVIGFHFLCKNTKILGRISNKLLLLFSPLSY